LPRAWASSSSASRRGLSPAVRRACASLRAWAMVRGAGGPGWPMASRRGGGGKFGELIGLILVDQRPDEVVEITLQHGVELVEGELDAMVGDSSVRIVVGADLLRTVAAAHQQPALLGLCLLVLGFLRGLQSGLQQRHGA